jgi:hypothetical protein
MDQAQEIIGNAVKPTRGARLIGIVQQISDLRPDAWESRVILDAILGTIKYGFDERDIVDVLDRGQGLEQALEDLDQRGLR